MALLCLAAVPLAGQGTSHLPHLIPDIPSQRQGQVIDSTLVVLRDHYVDSAVAIRMADALRVRQARGDYSRPAAADSFASRLTRDLRDVSHDKHIVITFDPIVPPLAVTPAPTRPADSPPRGDDYLNFGFRRLQRLPGNVGLLDLSVFVSPAEGAATLASSMQWLANTDALIIDLRDNDGGSPNMASLVTSYFIDSSVALTGIWSRDDQRLHEQHSTIDLPGPKYLGKPVVILTSHDGTVSAAEAFTYNMKTLQRAVTVGETSAGAANPGHPERVSSEFTLFVPTGRAVNPTTGTNWEGIGIAPSVVVDARHALDRGYRLALDTLLKRASSDAERARLGEVIGRGVVLEP